jgi:hypothetical protein
MLRKSLPDTSTRVIAEKRAAGLIEKDVHQAAVKRQESAVDDKGTVDAV